MQGDSNLDLATVIETEGLQVIANTSTVVNMGACMLGARWVTESFIHVFVRTVPARDIIATLKRQMLRRPLLLNGVTALW